MFPSLVIALLALSPSMAGPPQVAVHGAVTVDYTQSVMLTGPAVGSQCTGLAVTNDQGGTISVSRASSSWCQTGDGTMQFLTNNTLIVESDGIRVEPSSTNRVAYSEAINANWTITDLTKIGDIADPAGATSAEEFDLAAGGGNAKSPTFTITGTSAVLSVWYNHTGASNGTLVLRDTTAGADRCTITLTAGTTFSSTMSGRPSCNSTGIVSGNNHQVWFSPGDNGVSVWGVQVEPGRTVKTSYIPTSGAAVTRAADAISMTVTDNSTAGCAKATIKATNPASGERIFSKGSDMLAINAVSQIFSGDGTNTVFTGGGASNITDRSVVVRAQWGGGAIGLSLDSGAATGSGSFDGSMGSGTTFYIGSNTGVAQFFHGWIKAIKVSTSAGGCT